MECPVCKKEFNEVTGRRPKKFCSESCKIKFFNDIKIAKKKIKAFAKPTGVMVDITDLTKPTNEIKLKEQPITNFSIDTLSKIKEYEDQIKSIQDLGVKTVLAQKTIRFCQNKIYELKSKLNNH